MIPAVLAATVVALQLPPVQSAQLRPLPMTIATRLEHIEPSAQQTDAADAFRQGEEAYDRKAYAEAAEFFAQAQALVPHPSTQYNLGLAQAKAGDAIAAWQTFSTLARSAPAQAQRDEAAAQRNRVRPKIAIVWFEAPAGTAVCLDGVSLTANGKPMRQITNPGTHALSAAGVQTQLDLGPGETTHIDLTRRIALRQRHQRRRIVLPLVGVAAATGSVAVGLGAAAAVGQDDRRTGLAIAAAGMAFVATVASTAAIVVTATQPKPRLQTPTCRSAPASVPNDSAEARTPR